MYVLSQNEDYLVDFKGVKIEENEVGVDTTTYTMYALDGGNNKTVELGEYSSKSICIEQLRNISLCEKHNENLFTMPEFR